MGHWFRFYTESLHDPKILKLSDSSYRAWTILLCIAAGNDGILPSAADIALTLRVRSATVAGWITELTSGGLLDQTPIGFVPHNWDVRQYVSDSSDPTGAKRAKEYRDRKRAERDAVRDASRDGNGVIPVTVTDATNDQTRPDQSRTDKVTDAHTSRDEQFEEFWKVKPRRLGADPKVPARKLFEAAIRTGTPADKIISAAKRWAVVDADKIGTPYIPQAQKWLRDKRWGDYPEQESAQIISTRQYYAKADSPQLDAWDAYGRQTKGKNMPRDRNGGWFVDSEWPPGYRKEKTELIAFEIPQMKTMAG